jgi:hypothetical protein
MPNAAPRTLINATNAAPAATVATPARAPSAPAGRRPAGRPAVRLTAQPAAVPAGGATAPAGQSARVTDPRAAKDPRFTKAIEKLDKNAARLRKHDPAAKKAAEAQAAAQSPPKERIAGAQALKVEQMQAAETPKPKHASFLELLRAEIQKAMPKKLGDTDDFLDDDKKSEMKSGVTSNVNEQKDAATGDIKATTQSPPDPTQIPSKEVRPMPTDALTPETPAPIGARGAMPAPKTAEEVSLQKSKEGASSKLADADVTVEQLNKANDPRFTAVVRAKQAVERNADSAPRQFRAGEEKTLSKAKALASADERKAAGQLTGARQRAGANVKSRQQLAKERDEARRKEVADTIERLFNETKASVEGKLASLETDVNTMFDRGVETAMENMKRYVNMRKDAWKDERYDRIGGSLLWAKDKLFGLPDAVKVFYEEGRKLFIEEMDALVVRIADTVESRLKEAKGEIDKGQRRIHEYVESLPKDLQAVGKAAEKEMGSRFDELRQSVDDKKNDLAQGLAQRYKEARDKADSALKEMHEADKGLVTALIDKLAEIVEILRKFKERVMSMLKKGQDTIGLIVADPIGFLKNLLAAIKKGVGQFADRIWEHLKAGFLEWLFGSLAETGITLPKDFSLPSILKLVLDVLGINWPKIRGKVVKIIGERNMALLEAAVELVKALIDGGPAALWEKVKEYLGNLKEMVVESIKEWVVTSVIKAAVTKLATMFNPVGAIIQAILAIYNTVMFFIERINQILVFVEAIINSVFKIATGAIDDAANWIEAALARTIPLIIGFLARLLGLSGITEKIKGFILKIQTRVDQAIDKVIDKIVGGIKKLFAAGKAAVGKVLAWWKQKEVFTTEDGERHTLFFRGDGAAAQLVVASEERTLDTLLAPGGEHERQMNDSGSPAKRDALSKARKEHQNVKAAQATLQRAADDPAATRQLRQSFNALGGQLARMGVGIVKAGDLPDTVITHAAKGNKAGSVTASPLSKRGSGGSGPDPDITGWEHVVRIDPKSVNWERVHLVSEAFHGPGRFWNLIPARKSDNAWMREGPEKSIKTMRGKNMVLHYHVQVNGYHQLKYPPTGEAIEGFPTSVNITLTTMKKEKNKWVNDLVLNPFPTKSFTPPELIGGRGVDLKKANHQALEALGIVRGVANNVMKVKPTNGFQDEADFKLKMQIHYASLKPPFNVDFVKDHWPAFQELIGKGKAFF